MTRLLRALVCCAALACAAAPAARADIVATVPEGGFLADVAVAPNGQVWLLQGGPGPRTMSIGAVGAGGVTWRTVPLAAGDPNEVGRNRIYASADGGAWAVIGDGNIVRVAPDGTLRRMGDLGDPMDGIAATVTADGTLWGFTGPEQLTRITVAGQRTVSSITPPPAPPTERSTQCSARDAAVVRGGEVWLLDTSCRRFVELRPDASVIQGMSLRPAKDGRPEEPSSIAGAPDGSAWILAASGFDDIVEHVTAAGPVKTTLPFAYTPGPIATAPDSSAWVPVGGACGLLHVTSAGVEELLAPFFVNRLAAAPDGTLWLAGWSQVAHVAPAALPRGVKTCQTSKISLGLPDARHGAVSLRVLRTRGLRIRAGRAVTVQGQLTVAGQRTTVQIAAGPTPGVVRLSDRALALLAARIRAGKPTTIDASFLTAYGRDGLASQGLPERLRVTR